MFERSLPSGADVEDADGVGEDAVGDVIFETLQVAAVDAGRNLRAGERKAANLYFPVLVFAEEGVAEFCFRI